MAGEKLQPDAERRTIRYEAVVPSLLEHEKSIFDQPPFSWALDEVVEVGFFNEDSKEARATLWVLVTKWTRDLPDDVWRKSRAIPAAYSNEVKRLKQFVPEISALPRREVLFRLKPKVAALADWLKEYNFYDGFEYLQANLSSVGHDGTVRDKRDNLSQLDTYAAWANKARLREAARDGAKWAGLQEVLPAEISWDEDVVEATHASKGRVNSWFKLVANSEALR